MLNREGSRHRLESGWSPSRGCASIAPASAIYGSGQLREVYFWWSDGWFYGWDPYEEDDDTYPVGPFRQFWIAWDDYLRAVGATTQD